MNPPTPRQRQLLRFIGDFIRREAKAPTLREMCKAFGWGSTNAAMCHLEYLEAKGFVVLATDGKSRDLKVTEAGWLLLGFVKCNHCGSLVEPGKAA